MRKKILFVKDIMSIKDTAIAHRKYVKDILSVKDIIVRVKTKINFL